MDSLRRWSLRPPQPYALPLAADARLRPTDYVNDQVWDLSLGAGESPALALQSTYGGRVGLVTLIPLWIFDQRSIYEAQVYAKAPVITGFAPGYLRVQAEIVPSLGLQAEYWAIDSHSIGTRYRFRNKRDTALTFHVDLFAHVGAQGKEQPVYILPLDTGGHGLQLGQVGDLKPVVLMDAASAELLGRVSQSPKIGVDVEIAAGAAQELRWVHAGLHHAKDSLTTAQHWLESDWTPHIQKIEQAATAIPNIETGDEDLDLTIANAFHQLVTSFLRPTSSLPYASFVGKRSTTTGFAPDSEHFDRSWQGQAPTLAYPGALGIASIAPELAQAVVKNYLAVQQDNGWIDWQPGLGGQRHNSLCLPILARLAWGIFHYTEDDAFLRESLPGLQKFLACWLTQDQDGDKLPEWSSEVQTGYRFWPAFMTFQAWGEHTRINTVETPDLLAYLLSEAISLRAIAYYLGDTEAQEQAERQIAQIQTSLLSLWDDSAGRYQYQDRDTQISQTGTVILDQGRGDEEHILALPLDPPSRVNVLIEGGVSHTPRLTMRITGLDTEGQALELSIHSKDFIWQHNRGYFTSEQVFTQIDLIQCSGLSRVYTLTVRTPNHMHLDLNSLLPLWAVEIPDAAQHRLIELVSDPQHFWQTNGVSMISAQDPNYDPSGANGAGGVYPFWLTLIGESLIEAGRHDLASELLQRLIKTQVAVLSEQRQFYEFYHSDDPQGLGTPGYLGGIVPLHLLLRVLGLRIISSRKVWTGGPFHWPQAVTVHQHGVSVTRSDTGTQIRFPSGYEASLPAGADWQEIIDPQAAHG